MVSKYQAIIILSVLGKKDFILFCCVCHMCCNVYESHLQKTETKDSIS